MSARLEELQSVAYALARRGCNPTAPLGPQVEALVDALNDAEAKVNALLEVLYQVAVLGHGKCTIGKPLAEMVRAAITDQRAA